jgi:predicted TIM-barrel fold metal-dependent hydrolase
MRAGQRADSGSAAAAQQEDIMTVNAIDAWMQHPTDAWAAQPFLDSLRRWSPGTIPETAVPVEWSLERMDAAGVAHGMLNAWVGPYGDLISNDEVGAIVRDHPDRFTMVASLDIRKPAAAVAELRRCVEEYGAKAVRILPWLWNLPPNDRRFYPIFAACVELDIAFCTQIGHTGPLEPSEPGRPIPYLDTVLLEFPELRVIGGHIGVPWTDEVMSLATKYPNFYIDTSAYSTKRYPADIVAFLKGHGRGKVMFGTNHPAWPADMCLTHVDSLELDETTSQAFFHDNAVKAFKLDL